MKSLLAVDCGTQSLRTILFTTSGDIIEKAKIEYAPYTSSKPGWAEQDPEIFWQALIKGCRILEKQNTEAFRSIEGVGITALRNTMVNIGRDGNVLRPAISWLDTRGALGSYRPNSIMTTAYKIIGKYETIMKNMADGKCNWIRENQPDIWEQTWKYLQISGFLHFRLTGEATDSIASMVGHIPIDHKKRGWAGPHSLLSKLFPLEEEKRCTIVEAGEVIGNITDEASQLTGIRKGIPVIACGSDKSCENIGMGAIYPEMPALSFGTQATVQVTLRKYISPLPFIPAFSAAMPGTWVPEIEIYRGYWMLRWFADQLGYEEMEEAKRLGMIPEDVLNRLLENDPPGCNGLMLQPYWGPGLKDPFAKGSIIGFGDVHGKSSIYRAIIEGLGYGLREGLETLEKRGRFTSERIAASGGASQSDNICQITADIVNRPLVRGRTYESSALGAAIVTSVGVGIHTSYEQAIATMVSYGDIFKPRSEHVELYTKLFEIYKEIYPRMHTLYRRIRDITGYPDTHELL